MRASLVVACLVTLVPALARAHVTMTSPPPRYPAAEQKDAPCGRTGGLRSDRVTVLEPGARVVVRWDETIDHDSHYRIALDREGDDDLGEPVLRDGVWVSPAAVEVLADDIPDRRSGGLYEMEVTLPRIECERCTLQLIQVMYGRADPYYYQCADLVLRCATPGCLDGPDAGAPAEVDAGARDAGGGVTDPPDAGVDEGGARGGGCAASGVSAAGAGGWGIVMLVIAGALGWRRRR